MGAETEDMRGDDLALLLEEGSSSDAAKRIAREVSFNDSPLFGAKKKKLQMETELVMINTAVVIFAVNQVVDEREARPIIDSFLERSRIYIFGRLEKADKNFPAKYGQRMTDYFGILSKEKPVLGLSFAFMKHLGIDPLDSLQGQMLVMAHLSALLKEAVAIVEGGKA